MFYDYTELRRRVSTAVNAAFDKNPTSTTDIIDFLCVQLKPIVEQEQRAYTVAQLKEMLISVS